MAEPIHKLQELVDERQKVFKAAGEILDKAEAEGRSLNDEEQGKYDELFAKTEELRSRHDRLKAHLDAEKELRDLEANRPKMSADPDPESRSEPEKAKADDEAKARSKAFERYLKFGERHLGGAELRALQSDNDPQAGYLLPDMQWIDQMIKGIDDRVFIRQRANKFRLPVAESLGAPKRTARTSAFAWGAEIATPTADSDLSFGRRQLEPHYASARILVSRDLLRRAPDVAGIVRQEFEYEFATNEEDAFFTGSGAQQPLGVFTDSSDGISSSRDVTASGTTDFDWDDLIDWKFNLKSEYWSSASAIMHQDVFKVAVKLKDGEGQPVVRLSTRGGEPDEIVGIPVAISQRAPSTLTTGQYVAIMGDWRWYWIVDALDMEMLRLDELNARTNQVEFIVRKKLDGAPVLEEAFSRLVLA